MKTILAAIVFTYVVSVSSWAQSYDSDSVYYSSIPKTQKKKSASTETGKKIAYFFTIQSGALIGCKDCSFKKEVSFTSATIHGITIGRNLRVGAGIGFDGYQNWQTMPVFGSVSWDLFGNKNSNALFVQFNYGWSKPWANRATLYSYQDINGGRMVSTQVGYRIKYHDLKISFGLGSKYQRITASYQYPVYYYDFRSMPVFGDFNKTTLRESINRLSLIMAIGWK